MRVVIVGKVVKSNKFYKWAVIDTKSGEFLVDCCELEVSNEIIEVECETRIVRGNMYFSAIEQ